MGRNLISCCHRCKEQCYHFRGEEQKTILPFYIKHTECMQENQSNVETLDDQYQEEVWMSGGYGLMPTYKGDKSKMRLTDLARHIEMAVNYSPPSILTDMCKEYYQPYYHLMYLLAGDIESGCIVELGVNKGYGIASFAHGNPGAKVVGFDLNVEPEFCPDNVDFHLVSALPVPDFMEPESIAVLHIDTEHSYGNALNEFGQYRPYLMPGAVVMFDDLHAMDSGVARAFYELPYPKIQDDRLHPDNGYGVLLYE